MSFPMPKLDDRSFQDIVDEAKRRIPLHTPEWTDHNVADPGVALIELFAWMTESITYRLNQVPDKLYRSFLNLLGIGPYAPQPAQTAVTFWVADTDTGTHEIPMGSRTATTQDAQREAIEFMTTHEVVIRQPILQTSLTSTDREGPELATPSAEVDHAAGQGVFVDNQDNVQWRTLPARGDLRLLPTTLDVAATPVDCFPNNRVGDCLYFGFAESLAANVLQLKVTTSIEGIGVMPSNIPWIWEVSSKRGEEEARAGISEWRVAEVVSDTTAGFNKSGNVTLFLPFDHEETLCDNSTAFWLRVRMTTGQPKYERSPTIDRIEFRSLGARAHSAQGVRLNLEELGVSSGRPDQSFFVRHPPVLPRPKHSHDGEPLETVAVIAPDGTTEEVWQEVEDFARSGRGDPHYTLDSATGEVRFGPMIREVHDRVRGEQNEILPPMEVLHQRGKIPAARSRIVIESYRSGGGAHGNVSADTIIVSRDPLAFVQRVNNHRAAIGGVDPETIENAKIRGPLTLITGDRAVTENDFTQLIRARFPLIKRVRCVIDDQTHIRVLVVPQATGDMSTLAHFIPEQYVIDDIKEMLDRRRLIGTTIRVEPPNYRGVSVAVRLQPHPTANRTDLEKLCEALIDDYVHPLRGGPNGTGWRWGDKLDQALIRKLLMPVEQVSIIEEVRFFRVAFDGHDHYTVGTRVGEGAEEFALADDELPLSVFSKVLVARPDEVARHMTVAAAADTAARDDSSPLPVDGSDLGGDDGDGEATSASS